MQTKERRRSGRNMSSGEGASHNSRELERYCWLLRKARSSVQREWRVLASAPLASFKFHPASKSMPWQPEHGHTILMLSILTGMPGVAVSSVDLHLEVGDVLNNTAAGGAGRGRKRARRAVSPRARERNMLESGPWKVLRPAVGLCPVAPQHTRATP